MPILHDLIERENDVETLRKLLRRGADPNSLIRLDRTPLHIAILKIERNPQDTDEILPIVQELIDFGANVNQRDDEMGSTPLHLAVICRNYKTVHMLLEKGADINLKDLCGWSSLHHGVTSAFFSRMDGTVPMYAVDISIVDLLLSYNLNVDLENEIHKTALMLAVRDDNILIVNKLLEKNASVNFQNAVGDTVMHTLFYDSEINIEILWTLARNGGSFNIVNADNQYPMDYFCRQLLRYHSEDALEKSIYVFKLFLLRDTFNVYQERCIADISRDVNNLSRALDMCNREVIRMRSDELVPNINIYNIAIRCAFHLDAENCDIPNLVYDKLLEKLMNNSYFMYSDVLSFGICRKYLRSRFATTCKGIYMHNVRMNEDTLHSMSKEMTNYDIFKTMIACRGLEPLPSFHNSTSCSIS